MKAYGMSTKTRTRAFSLVEMIIVVVIIGILAAIAIPRLSRGASGASDSGVRGNLSVLRNGIELYFYEHGEYPGKNAAGASAAGIVIEHVPDPRGFAEKSYKLLRDGGLFLCETPNIDCTDARLFRNRYWGGYHFPRHWTLYTKETLTWMLKDVGYEILDVKYYPNPVFWVWTLHHILKENGFPAFVWKMFPVVEVFDNSFVNMIRLGILTVVDRFLSLFSGGRMGSMMIIARKVTP